jgi:hypothetical protein
MSRKDNLLIREKQRAQQEADHQKSFTVRNYSLYVVGIVIMILGGIISALTEGWNLNHKFGSLGLAVFGVGVIEFVSIYFGGGVVNDIRNGIFSADGISKAIFICKILLYAGATYFSISLTLEGAPDFYAERKQQKTPPTLLSEEGVKAEYAAKADSLRVSLRSLEATTWKGKIVTDVRPTIALLNTQLVELSNKESADLDKVRDKNAVIQDDWDNKLSDDQDMVMMFAGLGEALKIASIILIALFKEGRDEELGIHKLERITGIDIDGDGMIGTPPPPQKSGFYQIPSNNNRGSNSSEQQSAYPTPVQRIGFRQGYTLEPDTSTQPAPSVANVSYTPVHEEMEGDYPIDLLKELRFYADAKRQYDCYEANTRVATETKAKRQEVFRKRMAHSLTNMNDMGYQPRLVNRTWELIPLN